MNKRIHKPHKKHKSGAERKQRNIPYPNRLCVKVSDIHLKKLEYIAQRDSKILSECLRDAISDYVVNCEVPERIEATANQLALFDA